MTQETVTPASLARIRRDPSRARTASATRERRSSRTPSATPTTGIAISFTAHGGTLDMPTKPGDLSRKTTQRCRVCPRKKARGGLLRAG